jgi:hypothetical protein
MTTRPFFCFSRRYNAERAVKDIAIASIRAGGYKNLLAILGMSFAAIISFARTAIWLVCIATGWNVIPHPWDRSSTPSTQAALPQCQVLSDDPSPGPHRIDAK